MVKEKICLGCNCNAECLDQDAEAVLWINDYYRNKAKELHLYGSTVECYVMPNFWQTQEEFCFAKDYATKVYMSVLVELARQLDELHCSSFGERGWNIILGDWLRIYIEGFYDKYMRIKYAAEHYPNLYMKKSDIWYIPRGKFLRDNEVLQAQQFRDAYNFIYFDSTMANVEIERYEIMPYIISEMGQDNEQHNVKYELVGTLKKLICRKETTLYFSSQYLNLSRTTLELLSRGRISRLELPNETSGQSAISADMRRKFKRCLNYGDEFIDLIYDCLYRHIPMEFVEDFQEYYEAYQKLELKISAKIVDSNMIYHNILFKIFVAHAINHGGKLEIIQHGGDYCIEKYVGSWEFQIADKFYTWGTGFIKNSKTNMQAMPCPKTLSVRKKRKKNILFVEYANYPYVPRIEELHAMKMEEFYGQEEVFFQLLEKKSRDLLQVRCHHFDRWWNRKRVLAQKFPWMQFDVNQSYYASMTEARLVVTNVIGTTCMEAISCDIPMIIFLNDDFFVPDENAVEILDELRRVGVLFDSPERAAEFINKNVERIDKWWNERERKNVINKFSEMYASHGRFSKLKWVRELVKESKSE